MVYDFSILAWKNRQHDQKSLELQNEAQEGTLLRTDHQCRKERKLPWVEPSGKGTNTCNKIEELAFGLVN